MCVCVRLSGLTGLRSTRGAKPCEGNRKGVGPEGVERRCRRYTGPDALLACHPCSPPPPLWPAMLRAVLPSSLGREGRMPWSAAPRHATPRTVQRTMQMESILPLDSLPMDAPGTARAGVAPSGSVQVKSAVYRYI